MCDKVQSNVYVMLLCVIEIEKPQRLLSFVQLSARKWQQSCPVKVTRYSVVKDDAEGRIFSPRSGQASRWRIWLDYRRRVHPPVGFHYTCTWNVRLPIWGQICFLQDNTDRAGGWKIWRVFSCQKSPCEHRRPDQLTLFSSLDKRKETLLPFLCLLH